MPNLLITGVDKPAANDDRWVQLRRRRYVDRGGNRGAWTYATRRLGEVVPARVWPAGDAVVFCALVRGEDGIVRAALSREFRIPLADYEVGFGAGLLEAGETPEDAGARELSEEFPGLRCKRVFPELTSPLLVSSAGLSDEAVVMVFMEAEGDLLEGPGGDAGEEIIPGLYDHAEVMALMGDRSLQFSSKAWPIFLGWKWAGKLTFGQPGL